MKPQPSLDPRLVMGLLEMFFICFLRVCVRGVAQFACMPVFVSRVCV